MAATRRLGRPLMVPRSFLTISPSRVRAESRARALGQAVQKQARSWCWLSATFAGTSPLQCMMVGEGQGQAGKSRKWARREEERARLDWEAQRLQPLPQQNRPASLWPVSGSFACVFFPLFVIQILSFFGVPGNFRWLDCWLFQGG